MSLILERVLMRRKTEILITIVLFVLAISLIILSLGPLKYLLIVQLGEKFSFATIIALAVRWIGISFSEAEFTEDSDENEYHEAIKKAHDRIWIYQTWLPSLEKDAFEILHTSKASNIRIMLASFKQDSPIFARIASRRLKVSIAKANVGSSVKLFIEEKKKDCLKFNYGHHPSWIAVIDSLVFWGPTPVDRDSHAINFLFHKHPVKGPKGVFWKAQFESLWDHHSHDFDTEKTFNEELEELELTQVRLTTRSSGGREAKF